MEEEIVTTKECGPYSTALIIIAADLLKFL